MIVSIHQPHYFPWLGYFDKMAKSDRFILMDKVQYVPKTYMSRNTFITKNGSSKYLSVPVNKKGYQEKELREIEVSKDTDWQKKHQNFFIENYKSFPYFDEIYSKIEFIFNKEYKLLIEVQHDSINILKEILDIDTELVFQSSLETVKIQLINEINLNGINDRRCSDIIRICKSAEASDYITGKGASIEFINSQMFCEESIKLHYQQYTSPKYRQRYTSEFIPNITALDFILNCGIHEAKDIFWKTVHDGMEVL